MVLKTELCRFSGQKIYPGRGIRFIRSDSQVFLFANSKCKRYFHNRLKPSKLTWTAVFRKQHKKDIAAEAVKKKRRTNKKPYSRSIVGASLEVIQKKRAEKPEVRDAAREAAIRSRRGLRRPRMRRRRRRLKFPSHRSHKVRVVCPRVLHPREDPSLAVAVESGKFDPTLS
ncbi:60S ribosomal protein L24 [Linum grandiflorum]